MREHIRTAAKRLQNLGFFRLRNGYPTPNDEDRELLETVIAICFRDEMEAGDRPDQSGVLLDILGIPKE